MNTLMMLVGRLNLYIGSRSNTTRSGRASCEVLVQRTLSQWNASESESVIPEASEVLCSQLTSSQTPKGTEKEIFVPVLQGHQILPVY